MALELDKTSPFNLTDYESDGKQPLYRVNETKSVSPGYTRDEQLEQIKDVFQKRFGGVANKVDMREGSSALKLAECSADLASSIVSVCSMMMNQLNLNYSKGVFLDSQGALFAVERKGKSATRVTCRFTGTLGVTVPAGTTVKDTSGNLFVLESDVVLGRIIISSGNACGDGEVVCTEKGEIEVAANTVTTMAVGVSGVSSVTNPSVGTTGSDVETDDAFRRRIMACRYSCNSYVGSILSRIHEVDGVKGCVVYDNGTDGPMFIRSDGSTYYASDRESGGTTDIAVLPHSILAIVDGGSSSDIAEAIAETKPSGTNMTPLYVLNTETSSEAYAGKVYQVSPGDSRLNCVKTATYKDSRSGVSYSIVYNTGTEHPFRVSITVLKHQYSGTDSELTEEVKNAILSWQVGNSAVVDGLTLGTNVYRYELSAAVSDAVPSIRVKAVTLYDGSSLSVSTSIAIPANEKAVTTASDITVVVE